jgi:hypothetical protein
MNGYLSGIAAQMGTNTTHLSRLIDHGICAPSIAGPIGTSSRSVEAFIKGTADKGIGRVLGTSVPDAQSFRDEIGRAGAVNVIIGLGCGVAICGED